MADYSVFDSFCKIPTWDTPHALDEQRFYLALKQVIDDSTFSPEEMGDYIRQNHASPIWPKSSENLEAVIERLVANAWAVKSFMAVY